MYCQLVLALIGSSGMEDSSSVLLSAEASKGSKTQLCAALPFAGHSLTLLPFAKCPSWTSMARSVPFAFRA